MLGSYDTYRSLKLFISMNLFSLIKWNNNTTNLKTPVAVSNSSVHPRIDKKKLCRTVTWSSSIEVFYLPGERHVSWNPLREVFIVPARVLVPDECECDFETFSDKISLDSGPFSIGGPIQLF